MRAGPGGWSESLREKYGDRFLAEEAAARRRRRGVEGPLRGVHAGVGVEHADREVLRQRVRQPDLPVLVRREGIVRDTGGRGALEFLDAVVQVQRELVDQRDVGVEVDVIR